MTELWRLAASELAPWQARPLRRAGRPAHQSTRRPKWRQLFSGASASSAGRVRVHSA